jgi:hypothetical protein
MTRETREHADPLAPDQPSGVDSVAAAVVTAGARRRTFLRMGAAASPVLLTVVSRPVGATNCVLASSFVSRTTMISRNGGSTAPINCTAYNLTHWRNVCTAQPNHVHLVKTVATYLGCSSSLPYGTSTVKAVLQDTALTDPLRVLQRILVMCLNVDSGYIATTGGFSKAYLTGVWTAYAPTQTYTMAGGSMNSQKLAEWLDYLMNPLNL